MNMKKSAITSLLITAMIFANEQSYAQETKLLTRYGDDVGTLDGIIKAYYDVVTLKKGEKVSYERDSLLHIAGVRVGSAGISDGHPILHYTSLKEYHRQSDAYMEKNGYYERETS